MPELDKPDRIAREARGRGLATQALRLVSRWVLAALAVERLELVTEPKNVRSQHAAQKAGFRREGLLRRYLEVKGERRDCVMFSLLAEDLGKGGLGETSLSRRAALLAPRAASSVVSV